MLLYLSQPMKNFFFSIEKSVNPRTAEDFRWVFGLKKNVLAKFFLDQTTTIKCTHLTKVKQITPQKKKGCRLEHTVQVQDQVHTE